MQYKYWIPQYRWQLIDLLSAHYPTYRAQYRRMRKKQLYRILFEIRKKPSKSGEGKQNEVLEHTGC